VNYVNKSGKEAFIAISDVSGKVLIRQKLLKGGSNSAVNLTALRTGIYFYRITEGGIVTVQGKITKD
jgi:hypothetical protein